MWFQVVCIINMKTQLLGSYVGMFGCLGTMYLQNLDTNKHIHQLDSFFEEEVDDDPDNSNMLEFLPITGPNIQLPPATHTPMELEAGSTEHQIASGEFGVDDDEAS